MFVLHTISKVVDLQSGRIKRVHVEFGRLTYFNSFFYPLDFLCYSQKKPKKPNERAVGYTEMNAQLRSFVQMQSHRRSVCEVSTKMNINKVLNGMDDII